MARTRSILSAFTAGEWSDRLVGRADLKTYPYAAQTIENMIVMPQGGVQKRSGTRFVATGIGTTVGAFSRLVPFEFNDEQQYILEFGNNVIRVFRNDGNGNPVQLTHLGNPTTVTQVSTPTVYPTADLRNLKFAQYGDTLIVVNGNNAPRRIRRIGITDTDPASWEMSFMPVLDGPYLDINTTATTITPSATTGTVTLTASAALWVASDVNRWVRLLHSGTWGWARITVFTSSTVVTAVVFSPFAATTASANWRLGVFHDGNYPRTVAFHEQRLWYANPPSDPQGLYASVTGDYETFSPSQTSGTVGDDSALSLEVASDQADPIYWLMSDTYGLIILTAGSEFALRTPNSSAITPANFTIRRQSSFGAHPTATPRIVGSQPMFWERLDRRLRLLQYNLDQDRMVGSDATAFAEHIAAQFQPVDTAIQRTPYPILWTALDDGTIAGLTYQLDQRVLAWHRHRLGGDGFVESIAIIRGKRDQVWMSVRRALDGGVQRWIEVMEAPFDHGVDHEDAWTVDAGLRFNGSPTDTVSGLGHFPDDTTLAVMADGSTHPPVDVAAGSLPLNAEYSKIVAGLPFTAILTPLPFVTTDAGDSRFRKATAVNLLLRLWRSLGGEIGVATTEGLSFWPIIYRTPSMPMNQGPPLFTGIKEKGTSNLDNDLRTVTITIRHTEPQPFTLLSLATEIHLGEH
jgi:hypothetical protein